MSNKTKTTPATPAALESRDASERAAALATELRRSEAERDRGVEAARQAKHTAESRHMRHEAHLNARAQAIADRFDAEIAAELLTEGAPIVAELREQPTRPAAARLAALFRAAEARTLAELGEPCEMTSLLALLFAEHEIAQRPEALAPLGVTGGITGDSLGMSPGILDLAYAAELDIRSDNIPALTHAIDRLDAAIATRARVIFNTTPQDLAECRGRLDAFRCATRSRRGRAGEDFERYAREERAAAAIADNEAHRLKIYRYRTGEMSDAEASETMAPEEMQAYQRATESGGFGPWLRGVARDTIEALRGRRDATDPQ